VGLGLGALAVLVGLALRDLGPRRWPVRHDVALPVAVVARRVRRGRSLRAAGLTLALAGASVWGITFLSLVAQVSDEHGDMFVLSALVTAAGAIGIWALLYRRFAARPPGQALFPRPPAHRQHRPVGRSSRRRSPASTAGSRPAATLRAARVDTAAAVRHVFDLDDPMIASDSNGAGREDVAHRLPDLPLAGAPAAGEDSAAADGAVTHLALPALPDLEDDDDASSFATRNANRARRAL